MPVKFRKELIASENFESAGVFDVDGDGVLDIVSGGFWYKGPDFRYRYPIGAVARHDDYYDDFSTIPLDVNGDGRIDYITGGWWGSTLRWRENPGEAGKPWPEHIIATVGNVETTRAWDVDGDGELEIVPNTPGHALAYYKAQRDSGGNGTGDFKGTLIYSQAQGHGLGYGDIDGDGVGEFVLRNGWLKRPENGGGEWTFHQEFDLGWDASVPILVVDVNGDGINDLIVGGSHSYGLSWVEQRIENGQRTWIKHPIDPFNSEYHDLHWVDIDGDGENELVTGKRYLAHPNGGDPGNWDDLGIYYFKWTGEGFAKQVISYGPLGVGAGCGIHFAIADLNGNGRLDIVAPGKDGLHVFWNEGV